MPYLTWNEQTITDFSPEHIQAMYHDGFVCTRPEDGLMKQTRSLRIDLSQFELSSENRRILRKTEDVHMLRQSLPYAAYSWEIGKLAKDFYSTKFGEGTFSANKAKELLTSGRKDFNTLLTYSINSSDEIAASPTAALSDNVVGYAICVETEELLHYSYPFYDLDAGKNTGMGMMLQALVYAKESGKKYIYLGSAQRPGDTYKFQFAGLEWFDGKVWNGDTSTLKRILQE
jgi:arginyl-tRNA--protein-N-Asp/Glu arginylyltransferase